MGGYYNPRINHSLLAPNDIKAFYYVIVEAHYQLNK